jgi:CRP-like cAMP-binding protein
LDFKGMGMSDRVPLRLPLTQMYVPLKARIELPEGETWAQELRLAGRRWASPPDADLPSEIPASRTEVAMLCNVSRNTFSRVVRGFSSRRLVTLDYRSLTVNDPARLRVVADAG